MSLIRTVSTTTSTVVEKGGEVTCTSMDALANGVDMVNVQLLHGKDVQKLSNKLSILEHTIEYKKRKLELDAELAALEEELAS